MTLVPPLARLVGSVNRLRVAVLVIAALATVAKLTIAANTFGTNDVHYWIEFAQGARQYGPVGMYGHDYPSAPWNHAPLSAYMLVVINWLVDHTSMGFPFLIRVPASFADIITALLVFELVRMIRPAKVAAISAVLVAWSPVLLIISGFHGNTDPVMIMLALLALYLLIKKWYFSAGLAIALSLSVKLIPVVLLPLLAVAVYRYGWRALVRFASGGLLVFVALWAPVLLNHWAKFSEGVLGYKGIPVREWGPHQFAVWAQINPKWIDLYVETGSITVLVLCSLAAAGLYLWRPTMLIPATGLALTSFLLLSPAFSMQYLVWPLAAAYLIGPWVGTLYNVTASIFMTVVYNNWNKAQPWDWYEGRGAVFRPRDFLLMVITWQALAIVVGIGTRNIIRRGKPADPPAEKPAQTTQTQAEPVTAF
jgi:4-amino-4-deoxy-L-arabinose transferase-like glycosyltransferase